MKQKIRNIAIWAAAVALALCTIAIYVELMALLLTVALGFKVTFLQTLAGNAVIGMIKGVYRYAGKIKIEN